MLNTLTAALSLLADFLSNPIISVPEHQVAGVTKLFASFGRKAGKLGVAAPTLVALSPDLVPMPKWRRILVVADDGDTREVGRLVLVPCRVYSVVGLTPRLDGRFEVLGRVEFLNGAAIIASAPGREVPTAYRSGSTHCDHCRTSRARKLAYVVRDCEADTTIQVGGSCIVDFFGKTSAADLAHRFTVLDSLASLLRGGDMDEDERGEVREHGHAIITFLTACVISMRVLGGFRSTKVTEGQSTYAHAMELLGDHGAKMQAAMEPGDAARAIVLLARARARYEGADIATLSSYEANMAVILRSDVVDGRLACATLASLPQMFARLDGEAVSKKAESGPKGHVGTVGAREVFELTFIRTASFVNHFGTVSFHTFEDRDGNVVSWKTAGGALTTPHRRDEHTGCYAVIEAGERVTLVATVKEHDLYKGVPQTKITRASFDLPKAKKGSKAA